MPPLAFFGTFTLLWLFPLGAPRQGGAPWFLYSVSSLFIAGIVTSAVSNLSVVATVFLEAPFLIGKALFGFAALSLQLMVPGKPAVLWPSRILLVGVIALPDMTYGWLLIAMAVAMQGTSGKLAIGAAIAVALGFSRFGHPILAAVGVIAVAILLTRRQLATK